MNTITSIRSLVVGMMLCGLPAVATAHDIVPFGTYPTAGSVTISTKAKKLMNDTFLAQSLLVSPEAGGVFGGTLGSGRPDMAGFLTFLNPKGSKAKAVMADAALEPWIDTVETLVRQYREEKGDIVASVAVTTKANGGTATFKTKPTPIGPNHKVSLALVMKFQAIVTLGDGRTKQGIVTATVNVKGVRLGFPGD